MVAPGKHAPPPLERPVHRERDPRRDRLHATAQCVVVVGFHDQMQVVPLDRLVNQAEVAALPGLAKALAQHAEEGALAEGRKPFADPHGDEGG